MRIVKSILGSFALAAGLAASPAQAAYHFCWALNVGSSYKEAIVSGIFTRPDGEYSVGIQNDWVSFMSNNGWKYSNSSYGCMGPYDSNQEAADARGDTIRSYDYDGYSLFYARYGS